MPPWRAPPPGKHGSHAGDLFVEPDAAAEAVQVLDGAGFQVHFHAIGDRAVRVALDAHDEEFGVERMSEAFRMAAPIGAETVLSRMQEELRQFTGDGPQMDDITLVASERKK